ncbi:hypothetical protein BH23ACT11_BH23ACT11_14060 [soil metagenome]
MIGARSIFLIGIGVVALILGFLLFGSGSNAPSGGSNATELVPVSPAEKVDRVSVDPYLRGNRKKDLLPISTLTYRGQTVTSAGEILGIWEPEGFFARSNGGPARGRMDASLGLSDGNLLKVPDDGELVFGYGGDPGSINFLDAVAFKVEKGELEYGKDSGALYVQADIRNPPRPAVVSLSRPELAGRKRVRLNPNLSRGVYVISVAASVTEGGVRYNFRVFVE